MWRPSEVGAPSKPDRSFLCVMADLAPHNAAPRRATWVPAAFSSFHRGRQQSVPGIGTAVRRQSPKGWVNRIALEG